MASNSYSVALPSLAAAFVTSVGVLFQLWIPLVAVLVGGPLVLFLFAAPFKGLLLWLFASPVLGSYVKLSLPAGVPDVTIDRLLVACIIMALALQVYFRNRHWLPVGRIEKAMLMFFIAGILDVLLRSPKKASDFLIFFDEFGIPFLLFVCAKNLVDSNDEIKTLIRVLFLVGLYLALHGIYQFFTQGSLATQYGGDAEALGHLLDGRSVGPFVSAEVYGTVLVFSFLWTLYLIQYAPTEFTKFFMIAGLGVMGLGIFLSLTRAVWVGLLVSLFVVQLIDRKWRKPFVLCIAGLIFLFLVTWFRSAETSKVKERVGALDTVYQRLATYQTALLMSWDNPVFGYGRSQEPFASGRTEYLAKVNSPGAQLAADIGPPHNQYLYTLVQYGLLGLVLYIAIFVAIVRSAITLARMLPDSEGSERQFVALYSGMLAAYLVQGLFVDTAAFPLMGSLAFLFAGILERLRLATRLDRAGQYFSGLAAA